MAKYNGDADSLDTETVPADEDQDTARKELFLTIGAIILYTVLAFGVILMMNAKAGFTPKWPARSPRGEAAIDISVVHTNDTWGYTDPCG